MTELKEQKESTFITIGNGSPKVAVIGCLHGDEVIGARVIAALKKLKLTRGSITFITAHPEAVAQRKRFIEKDMNRSFPGKKQGVLEERLAYALRPKLRGFDLVLDVHATNSNFDDLAIVVKFGARERAMLKNIPLKRVALMKESVFGKSSLIHHSSLGISLDYGPDKTGKNAPRAIAHIKTILRNLGMLSGAQKKFLNKELYLVSGAYALPPQAKPNPRLKNFVQIKKGDTIASTGKTKLYSDKTFYPLFLGKGRYEKTLALMASQKKNPRL